MRWPFFPPCTAPAPPPPAPGGVTAALSASCALPPETDSKTGSVTVQRQGWGGGERGWAHCGCGGARGLRSGARSCRRYHRMVGSQEKGSAEQPTATMNSECSRPAPAQHHRMFSAPCATCASEDGRGWVRTAELRVVGVRLGPDHSPVAVVLRTTHRHLLSEGARSLRARMRLCGGLAHVPVLSKPSRR